MVLIVQPMNSTDSTHFTAWKALNIPEGARDSNVSTADLLKALSYEFDAGSGSSSDSEEGVFDYKHLSDSDLEQLKRAFEKSKRIVAVDAKLRSMPELTLADRESSPAAGEEPSCVEKRPVLLRRKSVGESENFAAGLTSAFGALSDIRSLGGSEIEQENSPLPSLLRQNCVFRIESSVLDALSDISSLSNVEENKCQKSDVLQKLKALDGFGFDGSAPCADVSLQRQDCVYNL
jgi:hypothetical protein